MGRRFGWRQLAAGFFMRKRSSAAAVLLGAGSLAVGCRSESGTEPGGEHPPAMSSIAGQCLAPPSAVADTPPDLLTDELAGSTLIRARLATRLLRGGVLCFAPEGARWVLRWEMEP